MGTAIFAERMAHLRSKVGFDKSSISRHKGICNGAASLKDFVPASFEVHLPQHPLSAVAFVPAR
jgi:hypothetical protein